MGENVWGTVGQWFSGIVAVLALGYVLFREQILEHRKKPKLVLSFHMPPGYVDQVNTRQPDGSRHEGLQRWVRIQVKAEVGSNAAKQVRAYLVGIKHDYPHGESRPWPDHDVRQLQWMHGNYQPETRDLYPGITHQIDLLQAIDGQHVFHVRVDPPFAIEGGGQYVFTVHVAAENADPKGIEVTVAYDGTRASLRPVGFRLFDL